MKKLATLVTVISLLLYYGSANAQIFVRAGGDTTICAGNSITLGGDPTALGGTPPYTYSWCCGVASVANPVITPLSSTDYTVTVTDHVGNTATASAFVLVFPTPSLTITATHDTANYLRSDTLMATVAGGLSVYYNWVANGINVNGTSTSSGGSYLSYNYPGIFYSIATNYNYYCSDTVVTYIQGGLTASISSQTNARCSYTSDGALRVTVSGGTSNYTYKWSNGGNTQNLNNLSVGFYSLTVYDNLGNVGTVSTNITSPPPIQVSLQNDLVDGFPDTLSVSPSGGTPPYTYDWSNQVTTPANIVYASGAYACTVMDKELCYNYAETIVGIVANNDTFEVPENATSTLNVTQNDLLDRNNVLYAVITATTTPLHGTSSFNSAMAFYTPNANYVGTDSFIYTVCLGDTSNGFSLTSFCDTATVYLTVVDSILINLQVQPATCPSICNGRIQLQLSGGMPPYTFKWMDTLGTTISTSQNLANLCGGGYYTVIVTDANHVAVSTSVTVTSSAPVLTMYAYSDTVVVQIYNNVSPSVFTWSTGQVDTSIYGSAIAITQSGVYCVTATDTTAGCLLTDCDTVGCIGCVWPGDANDDGIVDNNDLLPIGLAYGATGPVRPNASLNWVGQASPDWTDTLLTGTNYKFIDCNGSGTIDANDTLAIHLNFGQIHLKSGEVRNWRSGIPALTINLSPDTLINGQTVTATFTLGSAALPADDVYGIAFTYNYDPAVIQPGSTQVSFGDSWVGNSTDKISLAQDLSNTGQLECALTRIDHNTVSGYGPIGMASFVITTDNINGLNLANYNMQTWISNLTVIDNVGNHLAFNEGGDTGVVQYTPTGIKEINLEAEIRIFPNPAHDQLIIQSQNQLAMQEITLVDLLGETVITQPVAQSYQTTIDVSSLSSGAYFVQVKTSGGTAMKRFVVAR